MTRLNWLLIVCSLFCKNALSVPSLEFFKYFAYIFSEKNLIDSLFTWSSGFFLHFRIENLFLSSLSLHPERDPRGQQAFWWTLPLGSTYIVSFRIEPRPHRINKVMFRYGILMGESHEIFCFRFFHESSPPKPPKITLGPFRIFSKIKTFLI